MASPFMNLTIPSPSVTPGPTWATQNSNCLTQIDSHNHTPGFGAPIPQTALDITGALSFNSQPATNLAAATFILQSSYTTPQSLYVAGTGDLFYTDGGGTAIQITSGGAVNATSSGLTGSGNQLASFSGSTLNVYADSTTSAPTPANIRGANFLLGSGTAGFYVTLQPPTLASSYPLTLPTIPASSKFLSIDSSGNFGSTWAVDGSTIEVSGGTTVQVKNNGITNAKLALQNWTGINVSSFTTTSGAYVAVCTAPSASFSQNRLIVAEVVPLINSGSSTAGNISATTPGPGSNEITFELALFISGSATILGSAYYACSVGPTVPYTVANPRFILSPIALGAGPLQLQLAARVDSHTAGSPTLNFTNIAFLVYEM